MERRSFFRLGMAATAVAAVETLKPSQAQGTFWWGCLSTPTIQCLPSPLTAPITLNIKFTAGRSGANGGFVLEWMTKKDYIANCYRWYNCWDSRLCVATFDPKDCRSPYSLEACESVTVPLGNLTGLPGVWTNCPVLLPMTTYIIRGYAQGYCWTYRSNYSCQIECTTVPIGLPPQ